MVWPGEFGAVQRGLVGSSVRALALWLVRCIWVDGGWKAARPFGSTGRNPHVGKPHVRTGAAAAAAAAARPRLHLPCDRTAGPGGAAPRGGKGMAVTQAFAGRLDGADEPGGRKDGADDDRGSGGAGKPALRMNDWMDKRPRRLKPQPRRRVNADRAAASASECRSASFARQPGAQRRWCTRLREAPMWFLRGFLRGG